MFGLNLFTIGRFFETTTLLWLTAIVISLVGAGGFLAKTSPGTKYETIGYSLAGFGILLLVIFLLYGYYFIHTFSGTCIVCPSTPIRLQLPGTGQIVPVSLTLPQQNPFENTFIFYVFIQEMIPTKGKQVQQSVRIIRRENHFGLSVDALDGTLYLDNGNGETLSSDKTQVGHLPFQTITQIAITQNQKTFSVFINGKLTGVHESKNLPYRPSDTTLFNESGGIRSGQVYHVELHNTQLTSEELRNQWESMKITFVNDTRNQGTTLPTNSSQSIVSWITGKFRMMFGYLAYPEGAEIAINSVKNL